MIISRAWAMPNADTFSIPVIKEFVHRYLCGVSIDPFARNKRWATYTNDINPDTSAEYHVDAIEFMRMLQTRGVRADCILFDPPYSPRQIAECYRSIGRTVTMQDTQSANFKRLIREHNRAMLNHGGVVLSFGWNSVGHGPAFEIEEILIVCHGGDHNDTICVAERMVSQQIGLL